MADHTIVFHLIRASKRLKGALGLKSDNLELSPSEAAALLFIDMNKDTSQIDIAMRLHLKPPSIVSLIDELEQLNLVSRKITKGDRRKYNVKLTEKGKEKVKKIKAKTSRIDNYIRSILSEKEVDILINAMDKLSEDDNFKIENLNSKEVKNEIPSAK